MRAAAWVDPIDESCAEQTLVLDAIRTVWLAHREDKVKYPTHPSGTLQLP